MNRSPPGLATGVIASSARDSKRTVPGRNSPRRHPDSIRVPELESRSGRGGQVIAVSGTLVDYCLVLRVAFAKTGGVLSIPNDGIRLQEWNREWDTG